MKWLAVILMLCLAGSNAATAAAASSVPGAEITAIPATATTATSPQMEFTATTHDFGAISSDGGKVSHDFTFTNTGDTPLLILKAETSCTCTKIDYPKKPISSGGKGTITVTYNPKKQSGTFHKAINLHVNTQPGAEVIFIKGTVIK